MYNRYLPSGDYQSPDAEGRPSEGFRLSHLLRRLGGNMKNAGISGILDGLGLGRLDKGDILLLLVLYYLYQESESEEWLIILALVLLMGLGEG